jgi:hypothetical protein
MIVNLLGYWMVGLPVSLLLGFRLERGATGLWWGLVVGLAVVAIFLLVRLRLRLSRPLRRVVMDEEEHRPGGGQPPAVGSGTREVGSDAPSHFPLPASHESRAMDA